LRPFIKKIDLNIYKLLNYLHIEFNIINVRYILKLFNKPFAHKINEIRIVTIVQITNRKYYTINKY